MKKWLNSEPDRSDKNLRKIIKKLIKISSKMPRNYRTEKPFKIQATLTKIILLSCIIFNGGNNR